MPSETKSTGYSEIPPRKRCEVFQKTGMATRRDIENVVG